MVCVVYGVIYEQDNFNPLTKSEKVLVRKIIKRKRFSGWNIITLKILEWLSQDS